MLLHCDDVEIVRFSSREEGKLGLPSLSKHRESGKLIFQCYNLHMILMRKSEGISWQYVSPVAADHCIYVLSLEMGPVSFWSVCLAYSVLELTSILKGLAPAALFVTKNLPIPQAETGTGWTLSQDRPSTLFAGSMEGTCRGALQKQSRGSGMRRGRWGGQGKRAGSCSLFQSLWRLSPNSCMWIL